MDIFKNNIFHPIVDDVTSKYLAIPLNTVCFNDINTYNVVVGRIDEAFVIETPRHVCRRFS